MNPPPTVRVLFLAAIGLLSGSIFPRPLPGVSRQVHREIRERYEGLTLRLRVDLRPAGTAREANVVSAEGVGYGRERSPVLFHRLEKVYVERVMSEGATRLALTVYRSRDEADQIRALSIPPALSSNPLAGSTLANFARSGSTTVVLEMRAGKRDPEGQMREAETLLGRLFYIDSEPTRAELEEAVLALRGQPLDRLRALTGLDADEIREILARPRDPSSHPIP